MQDPYSDLYGSPRHRYRPCLVLDMRIGAPIVCLIWLVLNMYIVALSFQKKSPVFSYGNPTILILQGVVCLFFAISTAFLFYAYMRMSTSTSLLKFMIFSTWVMVFLFFIIYLISIVLFGTQKNNFMNRCVQKSRQDLSSYYSSNVDSTIVLEFGTRGGNNTYNCHKLWEDEIKFSVFLFVLMLPLYVHSTYCFRSYVRNIEMTRANLYRFSNNFPQMMNNPNMAPAMHNLGPNQQCAPESLDNSKSLAQLTRAFLGRLR